MISLRPVWCVTVAVTALSATGCRTAGVNDLARRDLPATRPEHSAAEYLVVSNRNAELVQSLEARPSVTSNGSRLGSLNGKLAVERPRNFSLNLSTVTSDVADIGSNDEKFWFWFKDAPAVYFCNYSEAENLPPTAGLQPEWIVEALGLKIVSDDEARSIRVDPGTAADEPGSTVLTQRLVTGKAETYYKEVVVSGLTKRVARRRVFAADHKTLLARSTVFGYDEFVLPPAPGSEAESGEKVYLPHKLHLELVQEKTTLDVVLKDVKLNKLNPDRRQALFTEPRRNIARVSLPEQLGLAGGPTQVRDSLPAPGPIGGPKVRLSGPTPLGLDGTSRTAGEPLGLNADLPPLPNTPQGFEKVVGAKVPTADGEVAAEIAPRTSYRKSLAEGVER